MKRPALPAEFFPLGQHFHIQKKISHSLQGALEGNVIWSRQNAESLAFPSAFFDAYTIVFGIRNVTHIDMALAEAYRVLRPAGRFFCMEFGATDWPGFKEIYDAYSHRIMPKIGKIIAEDEESYRYLAESIRRFPLAADFKKMIQEAGFVNTRVEKFFGGAVNIHSGWKA